MQIHSKHTEIYQNALKILPERDEKNMSLFLAIQGIVQGVGFRPFVYRTAMKLALRGEVSNNAQGVEIKLSGEKNSILGFILELQDSPPPLSVIRNISLEHIDYIDYPSFSIKESEKGNAFEIDITPDIAICQACLKEMRDPENPRYQYPFINCTDCGPRYSIIQDLPYDRPMTTMRSFPMCTRCQKEYHDPLNRRFHAQPIACPDCGPCLDLLDSSGKSMNLSQKDIIQATCRLLKEGNILAIKGLGGFHLACRTDIFSTLSNLRQRKKRDEKPFAIMLRNLSAAEEVAFVSQEEKNILSSCASPIVLVKRKENSLVSHLVAPKLDSLGIMLPYTPLHHLLFDLGQWDALVMTSANVSDEPMIYQNQDCVKALKGIADFFLLHNRDIQNRIDDSLVRVVSQKPLFIRRARGYTPESLPSPLSVDGVVACGGVMKSTIAIGRGKRCYVSPYIGKMENLETYHSLSQTTGQLLHLLKVKPKIFACDLHPGSLSAQFARQESTEKALPLEYIQHHHAHAASCMAENDFSPEKQAICIIYDGTGYGEDGNIWGGEIFLASYKSYRRMAHLAYLPLPGGDMAIKYPWRIVFGILEEKAKEIFPQILEKEQEAILSLLQAQVSCPLTSSMGRLFDAMSALLGINTQMQYEGQPAMELEGIAQPQEKGKYQFSLQQTQDSVLLLQGAEILLQAWDDHKKHTSPSIISARFHNTIAQATAEISYRIAQEQGIYDVFLSGGCFQNALLLEKTISSLQGKKLEVHTHRLLSPNDEGISYGQAIIAAERKQINF